MTGPVLLTRRLLLRDMARAGLAMMVFGTAACSTDPTFNATPTEEPRGTTASSSSTSGQPSSTSPSSADPGHAWQRVDLGFVSAYILYRNGEAVVVDTGVAGSEGDIEAALGQVGLGWSDVGGVVLTHKHPDHQGSLEAVLAATREGIPWFAGAGDIDAIDAPSEGGVMRDGDRFNDLDIIETPGHTPGHISVLDPVAGILVAGDALNGDEGGVAGANPDFSEDMTLADASAIKLAGFDYEVALFGHGEPVLSGASALVADLAESLKPG